MAVVLLAAAVAIPVQLGLPVASDAKSAVAIAGVRLKMRPKTVIRILGKPQRKKRAGDGVCHELTYKYPDHLSVSFVLIQSDGNCFSNGKRRRWTAFVIKTSSPRDRFLPGLQVGSSAKRLRKRLKVRCYHRGSDEEGLSSSGSGVCYWHGLQIGKPNTEFFIRKHRIESIVLAHEYGS